MRWMRALIPALLWLGACAHARPQVTDTVNTPPDIANLVTLVPPGDVRYREAPVYIDSIRKEELKDRTIILVKGHFQNGCTQLLKASHRVEDDTLHLFLKGWRPAGRMCTQALQPFSYIYDRVPPDTLEHIQSFSYE